MTLACWEGHETRETTNRPDPPDPGRGFTERTVRWLGWWRKNRSIKVDNRHPGRYSESMTTHHIDMLAVAQAREALRAAETKAGRCYVELFHARRNRFDAEASPETTTDDYNDLCDLEAEAEQALKAADTEVTAVVDRLMSLHRGNYTR